MPLPGGDHESNRDMTEDKHEHEARVVGQLPARSNTNTEWDDAVTVAKENPGEAVHVATGINVVRINSVRQYTFRPPYKTAEGQIEVTLRGSRVEEDGVRRGDMYFTWHPTQRKG